MIRKHSAKCLTLKNVQRHDGSERTMHFILIGGQWYYQGTDEITVGKSDKDGFWKETIMESLSHGHSFTLKSIKNSFYIGPNKSVSCYTRTWETDYSKSEYQATKQETPF